MKYCRKCKRLLEDSRQECDCGAKTLSSDQPKSNDPVYLTTAHGFELDRLESALEDGKIPYEIRPVKKASIGVPVISGATNSDTDILVPFSKIGNAEDIVIGISASEFPGEAIDPGSQTQTAEPEEMSGGKRLAVQIISVAMLLALIAAVVFATDFVTGWIKGLF